MTSYANYYFYKNVFGGTDLPDAPTTIFLAYMLKASAILDEITFGRIRGVVTDDIKMATCAIADEVFKCKQAHDRIQGGAVTSESTGGDSVSYNINVPSEYSNEAYRKYYQAAAVHIRDKRLLERGCWQ